MKERSGDADRAAIESPRLSGQFRVTWNKGRYGERSRTRFTQHNSAMIPRRVAPKAIDHYHKGDGLQNA
jgi:hypothetical protein